METTGIILHSETKLIKAKTVYVLDIVYMYFSRVVKIILVNPWQHYHVSEFFPIDYIIYLLLKTYEDSISEVK